jgi:guanosine-3',5'-bis(diphosphate) 3'-pyrophosphohydrolase
MQYIDYTLLDKAVDWIYRLHEGQTRKHNDSPYFYHPISVMHILRYELGVDDLDALIAALLHDVLEDTKARPSEIVSKFNSTVLLYVDLLTRPRQAKGETKDDTLWRYNEGLRTAPILVKIIKAADCIHNLRECVNIPLDWLKNFIAKTRDVRVAIKDIPCIELLDKQIAIAEKVYEAAYTKRNTAV